MDCDSSRFSPGRAAVLLYDGSATFKQVFLEGDNVRLHALNPKVPDAPHPRHAVRTMYRAVRHTRSL